MGHVICVANLKGKTGRTLTAVNFAASLALLEKSVLLVDCDANGQASAFLGAGPMDESFGLDDLLSGIVGGRAVVKKTALDYLDLIPSGQFLGDIETILAQNPDKEKVLSIVLRKFRESYDYIIFDTAAGKNLITRSALMACDSLLIPLFLGRAAPPNLYSLLGFASDVRKNMADPLKISGILFLNCPDPSEIARCYRNHEFDDVNQAILPVTIPELAMDQGTGPLCLTDIKSPCAEAFLDLSFEFLYRENNK